jgi:hypothetical protein
MSPRHLARRKCALASKLQQIRRMTFVLALLGVSAISLLVATALAASRSDAVDRANSTAPDTRGLTWKVVTCGDAINVTKTPRPGGRILFRRITLPPEGLLLRPRASTRNKPLPGYAKRGIAVRASRDPVELIVPTRWRSRFEIGWGENSSGPQEATAVRVLGCNAVAGNNWFSYPGGFYVSRPACVPLDIHVGRATTRIHLAIGIPCSATA